MVIPILFAGGRERLRNVTFPTSFCLSKLPAWGGSGWRPTLSKIFPDYSYQLGEPATRGLVRKMLRNRRYSLEETRYKKDKGLVKVYMVDPWADPMMFQIGEYYEGREPDWDAIYDAAMDRHRENEVYGRERDPEDRDSFSTWLPSPPPLHNG